MKKCKICDKDTIKTIDPKTKKEYQKCLSCGYIYLEEIFYVDEARQKKHYDKHDNSFESIGYVKMFEDLIGEFVTPYKSDIKTALDFGCGRGEVLPALLERENILCDKYDIFYFPQKVYEDKSYDLIVSTEVFEHLQNPYDTLKELFAHMKKGSYLLLMTIFHPDNDEEFFKWWYIRDVTHIGFFNLSTFKHLSSTLNLKIVKHNGKNIILFQKI